MVEYDGWFTCNSRAFTACGVSCAHEAELRSMSRPTGAGSLHVVATRSGTFLTWSSSLCRLHVKDLPRCLRVLACPLAIEYVLLAPVSAPLKRIRIVLSMHACMHACICVCVCGACATCNLLQATGGFLRLDFLGAESCSGGERPGIARPLNESP